MPTAAMLNDPSPVLVKNCRRLRSLPVSVFFLFCHDRLFAYFCNPAPIAATEINPVGSAGIRLYDSMVIVPTGQRIGTQSAANAARLILQHRRASHHAQLLGRDFIELHTETFLVFSDVLHRFRLETRFGRATPVPDIFPGKHPRIRRIECTCCHLPECLRKWC